ncbi:MAG TPA: hypothetical protein VM925_25150 [Labilithrix sp.]|nr:hypothetical protein [Labilithrix sp.]
MVIGDDRIAVSGSAKLVKPEAGVDYPTDVPIPARYDGKQVLVVGNERLLVNLVQPIAGVDYPTEAPPSSDLVWEFSDSLRLGVSQIFSIEKAVAGVDFPTDAPAQDHLVVVTRTEERFPLR